MKSLVMLPFFLLLFISLVDSFYTLVYFGWFVCNVYLATYDDVLT